MDFPAGDRVDLRRLQRYIPFLNYLVEKYWNDPHKISVLNSFQTMIRVLKDDSKRLRPDLVVRVENALQKLCDEEKSSQGFKPGWDHISSSRPYERLSSPPLSRVLEQIMDDERQSSHARGGTWGQWEETPRSPSPEPVSRHPDAFDTRIQSQPRPIPTHAMDNRFSQRPASPEPTDFSSDYHALRPTVPVIPLEETPAYHPPYNPYPPRQYPNYEQPCPPGPPFHPVPPSYSAPFNSYQRHPYDSLSQPQPRMIPSERISDRTTRAGPWDHPPPQYYMGASMPPVHNDPRNYSAGHDPYYRHRNERDCREFQEDKPNASSWISFEQTPNPPSRENHVWRGSSNAYPAHNNYLPNEPPGRSRVEPPPHSNSPNRALENRRTLSSVAGPIHVPPPFSNRTPLLPTPSAPSAGDRNSFARASARWEAADPALKPSSTIAGSNKPAALASKTHDTQGSLPQNDTARSNETGKRVTSEERREERPSSREEKWSVSNAKEVRKSQGEQLRRQSTGEERVPVREQKVVKEVREVKEKAKETTSYHRHDPRAKSSLYSFGRQDAKRKEEVSKSVGSASEEAKLVSPLDSLYQPPSSTGNATGKGYGLQNFRIPKKKRVETSPPSTPPPALPVPSSSALSKSNAETCSVVPVVEQSETSGERVDNEQVRLEIIESYIKKALPSNEAKEILDKLRKLGSSEEQSSLYRELQGTEEDEVEEKLDLKRNLPRKAKNAPRARIVSSSEEEADEKVDDVKVESAALVTEPEPQPVVVIGKGDKLAAENTASQRKVKRNKTQLDRLQEDLVDFRKRFETADWQTRKARQKNAVSDSKNEAQEGTVSEQAGGDLVELDEKAETGAEEIAIAQEEAARASSPAKKKRRQAVKRQGRGRKKARKTKAVQGATQKVPQVNEEGTVPNTETGTVPMEEEVSLRATKDASTLPQETATVGPIQKRSRGRPRKRNLKNFVPTHLSLRGKRSMYVNEEETTSEGGEPYHTCPLCEYVCQNIVHHYVSEHPGMENPFVRFTGDITASGGPPPGWENYVKLPDLHWVPEKWVGGGTLKCHLCTPPAPSFDRKSQCLEHAMSHALPKGTLLACTWCKAEFDNIYALHDHVTGHTGEYRYTCGYCGYKCALLEGIEVHMGSLHTTQDRHFFEVDVAHVDQTQFWLEGFACGQCRFAQLSHERVKKHVESHGKGKEAGISRLAFVEVKSIVETKKEEAAVVDLPPIRDQTEEEDADLDRELQAMAQAVPKFGSDESDEEADLNSPLVIDESQAKEKDQSGEVPVEKAPDIPELIVMSPDEPQKTTQGTAPANQEPETHPTPASSVKSPASNSVSVDGDGESTFLKIESVVSIHPDQFFSDIESSPDKPRKALTFPPATPSRPRILRRTSTIVLSETDVSPSPLKVTKETEEEPIEEKGLELEGEGLTGHALFRCGNTLCDHSSVSSAGLKEHLSVCPLVKSCKQLTCRVCQRSFRQIGHLLEHLTLHGAKRFTCGLCQYKAPHSNHVKKHLKSVHKVGQWETISLTTPSDPDNGSFGIYPRDVVTPAMRLASGLPTLSPNKGRLAQNGASSDFSISNACGNLSIVKLTYSMNDVAVLPNKSIFTTALRCAHCAYSTKVRTNMIRHLNLHQNATLPITVTESVEPVDKDNNNGDSGACAVAARNPDIPAQAPINPVPCLEKKERMFDKMTNLAYSSHATEPRNLRTHISPTEMAHMPKFVEEHQRFVCGYKDCQYLTVNESMLKCHLVTLHKDEVFGCAHCPEKGSERVTHSLEAFRAHLKLHGPRLYKCGYCIYHHYQRQIIERHLNDEHPHQPPRECVIRGPEDEISMEASQSTARAENLSGKVSTKAMVAPDKMRYAWRCCMCKFGHDMESALEQHVHSVHGISARFKCYLCAFVAPERQTVEEHSVAQHERQDAQVLVMFYKMELADWEVMDTEAKASPAPSPLWRRDETRVRHIRGILLEDSSMKATAPVATILPSSPEKKQRKGTESGVTIKQEVSEEGIKTEMDKIVIPTSLGEPVGKCMVCPVCHVYRVTATRDMREHLYREFHYRKYKCAYCNIGNCCRKTMIRHVQTAHSLGSDYVCLDNSQPEFDVWVEQVLRHQTKALNRPLRMRKWHKAGLDSPTSSPTKKTRLTPSKINPEPSIIIDLSSQETISDHSSGETTATKQESVSPVDSSPKDTVKPPLLVLEGSPPAATTKKGKKRLRRVPSVRNLRNALVVNKPSGEQQLHCPACTYNSACSKDMEKHVNKTCPILFPCPGTSQDVISLTDELICVHCPVMSPDHESLRKHYDEVHLPVFTAENSLHLHPFAVRPFSSAGSKESATMTRKRQRAKPSGDYRCQHCKEIGEYDIMRQHSMERHPKEGRRLVKVYRKKRVAKTAQVQTGEVFVCGWCQTRFSQEDEVKQHHQEQHRASVLRYTRYDSSESADAGLRVQAGSDFEPAVQIESSKPTETSSETPKIMYDCPVCDYKSLNISNTISHLGKHCKPYKCATCAMFFLTKPKGLAHIAMRHPEQPMLYKIPTAATALDLLRQQVQGRPLRDKETVFTYRKVYRPDPNDPSDGTDPKSDGLLLETRQSIQNPKQLMVPELSDTPPSWSSLKLVSVSNVPAKPALAVPVCSPKNLASTATIPVPILIPIQPTGSTVNLNIPNRVPLPTLSLLPTLQPANVVPKPNVRAVARKSTSYRYSKEAWPVRGFSYYKNEATKREMDLTKVTAFMEMKEGIPVNVNVTTMAELIDLDPQLVLEDCLAQSEDNDDWIFEVEEDGDEDDEENDCEIMDD